METSYAVVGFAQVGFPGQRRELMTLLGTRVVVTFLEVDVVTKEDIGGVGVAVVEVCVGVQWP